MAKKTIDDFKNEINDSLTIIKREIESLMAFPHGWQSLATQLQKLLCDSTPLICRVISDPRFHPMRRQLFKSELADDRVKYHGRMMWRIRFEGGSMTIDCFDVSLPPIPLNRWLDQVIIEVDCVPLSIHEFITTPRNKEAAHSPTSIDRLLEAAKGGMTAVIPGGRIEPLPLGLAVIGSYVLVRVKAMLDELDGTSA